MTIPDIDCMYPRNNDHQTVYLKNAITRDAIVVGDYTIYNDFCDDPRDFERNNVLYQYPINKDRLIIGKFCSIACKAKFLMTSGNHAMGSLSTYTFPLFYEQWGLSIDHITSAWDNKGDIVVGNDVWIGYDALILSGVKIGDGAIIGARSLVTSDVPPYTIVGGTPAKAIRKRFGDDVVSELMRIKWWDWPYEKIRANIPHIQSANIDTLRKAQ